MSILQKSACKNDLGGIEAEGNYSKCYYGTKNSINDYMEKVKISLDYVGQDQTLEKREKALFFKQISRIYGRTALCLSGGAQLSWFHLGMVKALFKQKLLPQIFTGTSAGSMVAAAVCVRTNDELHELFDKRLAIHINCCEATWIVIIFNKSRFKSLWRTGAMFKDEDFVRKASWWTKGDTTFLEAFKRTGRILNITVMAHNTHSKLKVLNYINTPDVTIRSASVASSSIPGIIPACKLYMKDKDGKIVPYLSDGALWRDGSMISDIPEREMHQLFRVTHTIVSQVNPHISLFFYKPKGGAGSPAVRKGWRGGFILTFLIRLFLLDIHKWLNLIRDTNLLPRIMGSNFSNIWLQSFEGNVTILPEAPSVKTLLKLLTDPSEDELEEFIHQGELRTWPKILMISNQVGIEQKIGYWLNKLKDESFSDSKSN
jgi:predicted acylesterase/phospholipase RssA